MKKIAEIDCPIRCPFYHENTCFFEYDNDEKKYPECGWNQNMPSDVFPTNCPLEDAPSQKLGNGDTVPQQPLCASGDAKLPSLQNVIDHIAHSGSSTRTEEIIEVYSVIKKLGNFTKR